MARKLCPGLIPYLWVYLLWSLWRQWGAALLPPGAGSALLEAVVIKNVIWLLPLLPAVLRTEETDWLIPPRRAFAAPFPWLPCLALVCASLAFLYTVRLAAGEGNTIVFFEAVFVALALCAGVTEELVFRGYLFNRQAAALGVPWAAAVNGALFALIHYPGLIWGRGWGELVSLRTLLIFVMGTVFCLAFAKWKNLALTMTVHTVWNLLSYWFGLSG